MGMVDGPAADHGDPHVSPLLRFVVFVRLKNLAQNHFRNVSATCVGDLLEPAQCARVVAMI